jgi:hypothetical protein
MIETSESIVALTASLLKVQGHISGVKKDAKNPHFKNRYATLENVIDTARPALQEAGIAFTQAPGVVIDGSVEITTMLVHKSGEWMRSTLHVPLGKKDAQGVGSAITYGCRYSLMAMLGMPPTDDDGEAAMDRGGFDSEPKGKSSAQLKREVDWREVEKEVWECKTPLQLDKMRAHLRDRAIRESWNTQFKYAAKEILDKQEADIAEWNEAAHEQEEFASAVQKQFPGSNIISTIQAG